MKLQDEEILKRENRNKEIKKLLSEQRQKAKEFFRTKTNGLIFEENEKDYIITNIVDKITCIFNTEKRNFSFFIEDLDVTYFLKAVVLILSKDAYPEYSLSFKSKMIDPNNPNREIREIDCVMKAGVVVKLMAENNVIEIVSNKILNKRLSLSADSDSIFLFLEGNLLTPLYRQVEIGLDFNKFSCPAINVIFGEN